VFTAIDDDVFSWVYEKEKVHLKRVESCEYNFQLLMELARETIGVRSGIQCEDRSLDKLRDEEEPSEGCDKSQHVSLNLQESPLRKLFDLTVGPVIQLIHGDELIIVRDGPFWLAPYAAFIDPNSKCLCESFRIRLIPSLTSLKLITTCPVHCHSKTGALLVGDPWVQEVIHDEGQRLQQLPCAREK